MGTPERPSYSLLAYGSLLHPEELARHGIDPAACAPVRVRGFRRSFCQEPSWRPAVSEARAVLTVRPDPEHWLNAVLVPGLDADRVAELDHRERGYVRTGVPPERLEPYPGAAPAEAGEAVLYLGREDKFNRAILPSESYLDLCLEGAAAWGEDFLRDFVDTTFVQGEVPLLRHRPALRARHRFHP